MTNKKRRARRRSGRGPTNTFNESKNGLASGFKQSASTSLSRVSEGWMPIFPRTTYRTLRYHTHASLSSASGVVATYVFRANDLFDPDYTSTGHQPMGFDQLMAFYNHFAVDRAKIIVQATNNALGPMRVAIRVDADLTPITNPDQIIEFGGVTYDVLEAKNTYGSNKTLSLCLDVAQLQGIPRRNVTTDPQLRGNAAASPAEISYFHVLVWDPLASGGVVDIDVVLEQAAHFMEPRDLTTSISTSVPLTERKSLPAHIVNEQGRQNAARAMAEAATCVLPNGCPRLVSTRRS